MLFSIIVTVYNIELYIEECINSILRQTYKDFELILVDDGSTDRSGNICDHYAKIDNRITVIHKKNGGATSARNDGIEQAQGEYSIYVDGDDWIEPDELMQIYKIVKKHAVDLVEFGFYKEYEGLKEQRHASLNEGYYDSTLLWDEVKHLMNTRPCFIRALEGSIWCKAVRTDIFRKVEKNICPQITWGEDVLATFELLHVVKDFYVTHKPLYHYRIRTNSTMHKERISQIELVETQFLSVWNKYRRAESLDYLNYMVNYLLFLEEPEFAIEKYLAKIITPKAKIVIYGKGVFSKGIMEVAAKYATINIVAVIDSSDVDRIIEIDYDEVFIAITISSVVEKCIDLLGEKGVESEKIKYLNYKCIL